MPTQRRPSRFDRLPRMEATQRILTDLARHGELSWFDRQFAVRASDGEELRRLYQNQPWTVNEFLFCHRDHVPWQQHGYWVDGDRLRAVQPGEFSGQLNDLVNHLVDGIRSTQSSNTIEFRVRRSSTRVRTPVQTYSWELSFVLEEDAFFEPEELENSAETDEEEEVPDTLSIKQAVEYLRPGMLGLHSVPDKGPYNLLFHMDPIGDPRRSMLEGNGWFSFRQKEGVLYAPATLENYYTLEDSGITFHPTKRLKEWIKEKRSSTPIERWPSDCPLLPYQKEAVEFLLDRPRAMLTLSPGLGKTLTSAWSAGQAGFGNVLLVCPASLLHYWYAELRKWDRVLPMQRTMQIWHRETGIPPALTGDQQFWAITNPETLMRHREEIMQLVPWDALIADESIMYKHRTSKRSKAVLEAGKEIPVVWLLTGAPATRYLDDMWHQFHILNPRGYSSYWRFADKYCIVNETQWGKKIAANRLDGEDLIKKSFSDIYFARSQDQVLDIPDWLFEDVDIPMLDKQELVYSRLQEELLIQLGAMEDSEVINVTNRLSLVIRSLQVASNPMLIGSVNSSGKWTALPELMEIYPGPYIVWVNFIRTGEVLKEMFDSFGSREACLVNGATSMEERNALVEAFQRGAYDVIIMNNAVGKFGFNLTKARTAFFVERGYDDSYFQCLHRFRRIGTTESPIVVNMRSVTQAGSRTIDHAVHDALDYRTGMVRELTVGDLRTLDSE